MKITRKHFFGMLFAACGLRVAPAAAPAAKMRYFISGRKNGKNMLAAEYLESRQFSVEEVAHWYRVPLPMPPKVEILGISELEARLVEIARSFQAQPQRGER